MISKVRCSTLGWGSYYDWGSDYYRRNGRVMPENGLAQIRDMDAVYFGSAGDPNVPGKITLWGLRLAICQGFEQYANVRPARVLPGVSCPLAGCGPSDFDWIIVRENSEGEYAEVGGRAHQGHDAEVGMDVAVFTRSGVEWIARFAFDLGRTRSRKLLTMVTKSNAQRQGMVMWGGVFEKVRPDCPDLTMDKVLVGALTTRIVLNSKGIDVTAAVIAAINQENE